MKRADLTEKILDIKREKGWTWKHICDQIGGMSPMLVTGALLGQMKLTKPQAAKAAELFGLGNAERRRVSRVVQRRLRAGADDQARARPRGSRGDGRHA